MSGVKVFPVPADLSLVARLEPRLAEVSAKAAAIDQGLHDLRQCLAMLGEAKLLSLGADGSGTLADQAFVIRALARECMSTAFATWAQRMTIGYLSGWGSNSLQGQLLADLTTGKRPGATAMATAFQDVLGLREVPITAAFTGDDVVLNGTLPWASNVFADGAVVVLPARTTDGRRLIIAITTDLAGVELPPYPPLLALGSTASTSVHLTDVRVPSAWILTDRFTDFLADVRPTFLLLQTAFCLGLTDAALAGADGHLDGLESVFVDDHVRLVSEREGLDAQHEILLATDGPASAQHLKLRLAAATLTVEATRHESKVCGGAGYLATSSVARRLREATFLPIQSPTEAQLRWELSRFV